MLSQCNARGKKDDGVEAPFYRVMREGCAPPQCHNFTKEDHLSFADYQVFVASFRPSGLGFVASLGVAHPRALCDSLHSVHTHVCKLLC